ncbi:MAG: GFA family protein [Phycisphaerales bacterium]|nr:GFA family protein [Hyphomonadaceae bacterium]
MSVASLPGRCLCGAVRFAATPEKMTMDACHCSMCRRWGGGPAMTVFCADMQFENESAVGVYPSSDWAERGFCKTCGSSLFWRTRDHKMFTVSAHAFDNPEQFQFDVEIYIDEKPSNYAFANPTRKMTGGEVVAAFGNIGGADDHG